MCIRDRVLTKPIVFLFKNMLQLYEFYSFHFDSAIPCEGQVLLALKRGLFSRPAGGRIGPRRHTV